MKFQTNYLIQVSQNIYYMNNMKMTHLVKIGPLGLSLDDREKWKGDFYSTKDTSAKDSRVIYEAFMSSNKIPD